MYVFETVTEKLGQTYKTIRRAPRVMLYIYLMLIYIIGDSLRKLYSCVRVSLRKLHGIDVSYVIFVQCYDIIR